MQRVNKNRITLASQVAIAVVQAIRKGIVVRISHKTREEENLSQMVIITNNSKRLILILGVFFVFVSCDSNRVFDEYKSLENNSWPQAEPINFEAEITDTISRNNLYVTIRNNKRYPYSNLFLITNIIFPNGKKIVDTLQYEMADKNGKFLGNGISEIKHSKLILKENSIFHREGNMAPRKATEIGFNNRGGDIVGDHTVLICWRRRETSSLLIRQAAVKPFAKGQFVPRNLLQIKILDYLIF